MSPPLPPPFQFTLRQLLLLTFAVSIGLAVIFHWGPIGFALVYFIACITAVIRGAATRSDDWLGGGLAMLVLGLALGCLLPAVQSPREPSPRAHCTNNLRNITLALLQYHDSQGCFPPPYIADASGKPMHSWRVLILPYLDQKNLYRQYRFDEPWDGPNNRKLHDISLKIFQCPAHGKTQMRAETNYVAVVGPTTVWPDGKNSFARLADIIDGTSSTALLVEVADSGIHWMEPRDLHVSQMAPGINSQRGQGISSHHEGGANVAFADGSVRFLKNDIPAETIRAVLTRSGKEPLPKEP